MESDAALLNDFVLLLQQGLTVLRSIVDTGHALITRLSGFEFGNSSLVVIDGDTVDREYVGVVVGLCSLGVELLGVLGCKQHGLGDRSLHPQELADDDDAEDKFDIDHLRPPHSRATK